MTYSAQGNIETKSDLGDFTMNYGENGKPHALTSIDGNPAVFAADTLIASYTDFKKLKTLSTEYGKNYEITYGVDEQRRKSVYKIGGVLKQTRYYLGNYEEEIGNDGNVRKIHYLAGGGLFIQNRGNDSLLYIYTDYQGSLICLTDESGTPIENYAYDPWGKRRNPNDWNLPDERTNLLVNRGYTGHEHLDAFDIINMNGRVYDPLTGSFFSPDPNVQAPENWLNYNRYSYCYGNPLIYTDPDGEFIITALIIGAAIGAYSGGVIANGTYNPAKWNWSSGTTWNYMLGGATIGAVAGSFAYGAGAAVNGALHVGGFAGGAVTGAAAGATGGLINGFGMASLSGASFGDALKAGAMGGLIGAGIGGLVGGTIQGIIDYQNGYDFWNGSRIDEQIIGTNINETLTKGYNSSSQAEINDEILQYRVEQEFGVKKGDFGLNEITTKTGRGYGMTESGKYINLKTKNLVGGYVQRFAKGYSNMHISPHYTNANAIHFRMVVGHELIHAYHYATVTGFWGAFSERIAYKYSYDVLVNNNLYSEALALKQLAIKNSYWGWSPQTYSLRAPYRFFHIRK
ncbi:MAG: hypothetical protein LBR81_08705 [Prevotellaceae bacterium]|nr:hypothetical protein [Prevotellaceae bacterium]